MSDTVWWVDETTFLNQEQLDILRRWASQPQSIVMSKEHWDVLAGRRPLRGLAGSTARLKMNRKQRRAEIARKR